MRNDDLALLTVVGDDEADFDLLLGSLAYHMDAGFRRVVWHTGDRPARGIAWPAGVEVVHRPGYDAGAAFNYGHALNDATEWIAAHTDCVGVLRLDACEFWPRDWRAAEVVRRGRLARVHLEHALTPAVALHLRDDTRIAGWPTRSDARHTAGFHPIISGPRPPEVDLSDAVYLPRLRMALGPRSDAPPTAYSNPADGRLWKLVAPTAAWPKPLLDWRRTGRRPSVDFARCEYGVPRIF